MFGHQKPWLCASMLCLLSSTSAHQLSAEDTVIFAEVAEVTARDGSEQDSLGESVAISGQWIATGSRQDDEAGSNSGAVILFERGEAGRWRERAKLLVPGAIGGERFGSAVALDQEWLIAGAPFADAPEANSGAAYAFQRQADGVWDGGTQLLPADGSANDLYGSSVAIDLPYAVVGAPEDHRPVPEAGSVYLFELGPGGVWAEIAKLVASDADLLDHFGTSVSIAGRTVAVGAPLDDDFGPSSGSVYLFEQDDRGAWPEIAKRAASDGDTGELFGESIALGDSWLAVGAASDDAVDDFSGSVYLFARAEDRWIETQKLIPEDAAFLDLFGTSVALSGGRLAVGAIGDDADNRFSGSAYVFELSEGRWLESTEVVSGSGASGDEFGRSVALSSKALVVGAGRDDALGFDSGSASVFERVVVAPEIFIDGACPGPIEIGARGMTPRGTIVLFGSESEGSARVEEGPCAGTELQIDNPILIRERGVGFLRGRTFERIADAENCGLVLQAVDEVTCLTSGLATVPRSR